MEFHKFSSYRDYVRAQRKTVLNKIKRGKTRVGIYQEEIDTIARYMEGKFNGKGICHGVRLGYELDMFQEALGGRWIGTDIVKEVCDGVRILEHDFSMPVVEWMGAFGVVYSNSLDHSMDPERTLSVWLYQLAPEGRMFIAWHPYQNRLGVRGNKADCFAASLDEYYDLLMRVGEVKDVLPVEVDRYKRRVFVVGQK